MTLASVATFDPLEAVPPPGIIEIVGLVQPRGGPDAPFVLEVPRMRIPRGGRIALTGRSGSGKSTLLEVLGLLAAPGTAKTFCLTDADGAATDLATLWRHGDGAELVAIRAARIGFLLQDGGLLPYLDVRRNAELAWRLAWPGAPPNSARLYDLAAAMGLEAILDRVPSELSGGQRQRAAILRALLPGGDLLICDEPTTGLDAATARDVMALIDTCAAAASMTVIVASHDVPLLGAFGYDILEVTARLVGPRLVATVGPG